MTELPYVYAALLDVIGYRERLEHDRSRGTLEFKDVLERALRCLSDINDAEFAHQAISDTVILTCADRTRFVKFLEVLRSVQISFLANGVLLRGGVTYRQHFRSGSITYSHAYAGAHELESQLAVYPRIVVDHNVVDMLELSDSSKEVRESGLLCECNGVFFVNIVQQDNWRQLFEYARQIYLESEPRLRRLEAQFAKHLWLQEYLLASKHAVAEATRYTCPIRVWSTT